MERQVTYYQQVRYCGKPQCKKCREGIGHGPYWYASRTEGGRTTHTYIGKHLPPDVQLAGSQRSSPPDLAAVARVRVRVYALGQLRIERRSRQRWQAATEEAWQRPEERGLLGLLVSSPDRRLDRDQALEELWPDLDMKTATARLEHTLQSLQQLLAPPHRGASGGSPSHLLSSEGRALVLADQSLLWVDADAFEDLLAQSFSGDDPAGAEQLLEQAMSLYAGDLLPEERHAAWTIARRERLQQSWRVLLLKLADLRIARKAFAAALDPLDRLLAIDQENEAAVQRLMFALAQLKRRAEALRAYQRLASTLQQHHIAPQEETRALYESIQHSSGPVTNPTQPNAKNVGAPLAGALSPAENVGAPLAGAHPAGALYRWQAARSHQSPLVGRDAEFASIREVLRATVERARSSPPAQQSAPLLPLDTQRRPQYVLLMGGAGLGKTRLAEEISREAQEQDWAIIWSRTYAQESSIPYRLWIEILRTMINEDPRLAEELRQRPLVYAPLSVLLPELYGRLPHLTPLPPEQEQQRLWEAVLELCTVISEHTPLLIVLDDLQWADASSCELLTYLARRLSGHPVVFIGTCRDRELAAGHPLHTLIAHLHREHGILTLQLQPLTDEQIGALVGHVPETMMRTIQTRAAGNPFFAEELARSVEAQVAAPAQTARPDAAAYPLPDTIAAVLHLRISKLSSPCQRLLGNAAVLGGSFEFNVIREMEASGSAPADEDTVLDLLDEALQAGVLTEEGRGTRISYHFWHPLLVSLLYEGLSGAKRVLLHRRAAAIMRRMYAAREETVAATITHHLVTGGGEAEQIAHYATLAGNSAYALSAYPDAERYYRLAVEHTDAQAASQSAGKRLHLAYLLEQLAECLRVRGSFEEARALYERALDTRRFPRTFASAAEEQYEAQLQALLWSEVGWTWYYTGDNARAREYLDRGEQTLSEVGVAGGPAWARLHYQRSYIYWQEGSYQEARQEAHEALRLFEEVMRQKGQQAGRREGQQAEGQEEQAGGREQQAGRPQGIAPTYSSHEVSPATHIRRTLGGDPVDLARLHRFLGARASSVGRLTEALTHMNTALQLLNQQVHKREAGHLYNNIGYTHLEKAEHELAMSFFQRSLRLAEQLGDAPLEGLVFSNLGEMAARTGQLEEAESWFNRAIAQAEQINDQAYVSMWHALLAPVLQDLDRLADAEACIFRALTVGRAINNMPCVGLALVALGHMRIAQVMIANESQDGTLEEGAAHMDKQAPGGRDSKQPVTGEQERLLRRARTTLQHALGLVGLEAETRTRGQLAQAQVSLLAGDLDAAQQQAGHALAEADQYEMTRLSARAQALLGSILAAQGVHELAARHFEQAIHTCRERGLRLDYARALHSYAQVLLATGEEGPRRQALAYLREARQIFSECHAALDLTFAERTNARYTLMDSDNRTR